MTAAFLAALLIDTRGVTPDFAVTHAARAALAADPTLRDVNVVISVVDGGVVAGGPVPTDAAAERVATVLRGVPGVRHVRVACWVPATGDSLGDMVRKRVATDDRPAATVVAQRYVPDVPLLLDPAAVRATTAAPPPAKREFPAIPPPQVPVTPADDVATAVETVRTADLRFAALTANVAGSVVTIAGTAADAGDAWVLAAAVRRVPGVERVVMGRVRER